MCNKSIKWEMIPFICNTVISFSAEFLLFESILRCSLRTDLLPIDKFTVYVWSVSGPDVMPVNTLIIRMCRVTISPESKQI